MIILHCLTQQEWETVKKDKYYGKELLDSSNFIHCATIQDFWRVAPYFKEIKEPLLLLCIDTDKVEAEIKWEDDGNYGREYPHIYGELNLDAIVDVLPFLRDEHGDFLLSEELRSYQVEK